MADLIRTIAGMVLGIALPLVIQRAWARRLPPQRRARMWNVASWGAALYAFGPFSMLGFTWITRASAPYHEVPRAVALVASLFALGMTDVVLFSMSPKTGPSPVAIVVGVLTVLHPVIFAAATARGGDRARDAVAIGLGILTSVAVTAVVAGLGYLAAFAYEALFAAA